MRIHGPSKQNAEIVSVDPRTQTIIAALPDGGRIGINLTEVPTLFRWPRQGEHWTVVRDPQNPTLWNLGNRVQGRTIKVQNNKDAVAFEEDFPITELDVGEMKLDSDLVYDSQGRRLYTQDEFNAEMAHLTQWGEPDYKDLGIDSGWTTIPGSDWTVTRADGSSANYVITPPWDAWIEVHFQTPVRNNSSPGAWGRIDGFFTVTPDPPSLTGMLDTHNQWGRTSVYHHPLGEATPSLVMHTLIPLRANITYTIAPTVQYILASPWQLYRGIEYSYVSHSGLKKRV